MTATAVPTATNVPDGGRCGVNYGAATCASNLCCSTYNYCGNTQVHCQSTAAAAATITSSAPALATTWPHQNDPFTNCVEAKTVAIAFDDGPDNTTASLTGTVLNALAFPNVSIPAMFFEIGQKVAKNPQISKQVSNAGYIIGDHTWDHTSSTLLTSPEVQSEVTEAASEIQTATGNAPRYFRPTYGDYNTQSMQVWNSLNYYVIMWSIDTRDWVVGSTPQSVREDTDCTGCKL